MEETPKDPPMKGYHFRISYRGRLDGWGRDRFLNDLHALATEMQTKAELDRLDQLDQKVSGDDHPDALLAIMSAYGKNR